MARFPNSKGDKDNWDVVLKGYLDVSLDEEGQLRPEAVAEAGGVGRGAPVEPDRTLSVVGDVHIGIYPSDPEKHAAAVERQDEAFADLATIGGFHARRIYVGDLVDTPGTTGTTPGTDDLDFIFRADALDDDWLAVPGNHDISWSRTAEHWGQVYGFEGGNWARDLGFCRVIGIASDGPSSPHSTMPTETLEFLDAELAKSRKDTIVVCHFPLHGTVSPHPLDKGYSAYSSDYPSSARYASPDPNVRAVLDRHPQARVWLNGHSHSPLSAPDLFTQVWTGSRHIASINASAIPYTDANVGSLGDDPTRSIYLTMLDDRCEVRVRNHRDGQWERYRHAYVYPERWAVPTLAAAEDNPAALVMTFADEEIAAIDRYGEAGFSFTGTDSYETAGGLTGLVMDDSDILTVDPRSYLTPDTGSIVIRARFVEAAEGSSNYLVSHNPGDPPDQRLSLLRSPSGTVGFQFGTASGSASSIAPVADTDIHTFGISWRDGWFGLLHLDGVRQNYAYSSNDLSTVITTIADTLRFGTNRNCVIYGVYLATRELTPGEHDRMHRSIEWTWDTLNPRAGETTTLAPLPDPPPDPDPPAVPLTMVATFDDAIEAEDRDGPVSPTAAPSSPTYDTAGGRTGISLSGAVGNRVTFDPRDWITPGTGTVVVRARFVDAEPSGTEYVVYHSPSDPTNHRLNIMRQDEAVRGQIGSAAVPANSSDPLEDTDIHTFALSWRNGWECSLWVDGLHQADGRSNATPGEDALTTIGEAMDFVRSVSMILYEIAMADAELTPEQHETLHDATDPWSLTMLDEEE